MKKIVYLIIFFAIIIFLFLFFRNNETTKEVNEVAQNLKMVESFSVKKDFVRKSFDYSSVIKGEKQVFLNPKISGRVTKIYKKEGDLVKQGELLAQIDGSELLSETQKAKEMTEALSETLEQTEDYYEQLLEEAEEREDQAKDNYKKLKNDPSSTDEEKKEAKAQVEQAEEAVESAEELRDLQVEVAKSNLRDTETGLKVAQSYSNNTQVRAPFSGIITRKMQEEGSLVGPSQAIFELASEGNRQVEFYVLENQIQELFIGQEIQIMTNSINFNNQTCRAKITNISPALDKTTHKALAQALISEVNCLLKIGEFVQVRIERKSQEEKLLIPVSSVVKVYYEDTVYKISTKDSQKRVQKTNIKLGETFGNLVEVKEGLTEGDLIVVNGKFNLSDNEEVNVQQ
jgi:RND family efflux transporter MFP subunit